MKSGDVGRSAQRWPPARFTGSRSRFGLRQPNLRDLKLVNQQDLLQVEIDIRESRFAPAHLGHGNFAVSGMILFARMVVLRRVRMVHVHFVAVTVEQVGVEMGAAGAADVAIGIHMHVQAAELNGQEAHACGDQQRVPETMHGENCITPSRGPSGWPARSALSTVAAVRKTAKFARIVL